MSIQEEFLSGYSNIMLNDYYEVTMAYAYWKNGSYKKRATFEVFFRKNPFHGEYTIFAGLSDTINMIKNLKFTEEQVLYLQKEMPHCEPEFFDYLRSIDSSELTITAVPEGSFIYPREPIITVEGPLAICQLLETPMLNLCNFASLICTNATRMCYAAGPETKIVEFGLRRAQGPDGGMSASRYSYMGGCEGTSNILAGLKYDIPISGTHAHSYILSHNSLDDIKVSTLNGVDFKEVCLRVREEQGFDEANIGELAAFISYATAFPDKFVALIDTYDSLISGLPNYVCVAVALIKAGYHPIGFRLDSGDLAYLSQECFNIIKKVESVYHLGLDKVCIVCSNDINEEVIYSINKQPHHINMYGIGTHLVTCQGQPALGMVYKLTQIEDVKKVKMSEDKVKSTIPGKKEIYRLFGKDDICILDLMVQDGEPAPIAGQKILCHCLEDSNKKVFVSPSRVELLQHVYLKNGQIETPLTPIHEVRAYIKEQIPHFRNDVMRYLNPTPYKISASTNLYTYTQEMWLESKPIKELS
ncbi:hypothetical protein WA158_002519 [Blastocystis sp. Blastoise]